jgi:adenylosuccinate lyase
MSVCPIEYRYGFEEMKRIFTEEAKLDRILAVEGALALAQAESGRIPKKDADRIAAAARSGRVRLERVKELEAATRHDIMAVVKAFAEQCGSSGRFVHLGATSNDITDTAQALQFREALYILRSDLAGMRDALLKRALEHKDTVMLGRTHGQWAIPLTFGLKLAVFVSEFDRHIERLDQARDRICVGKMSGAVGTGAGYGPRALEIQQRVMKRLGLGVPDATSQVIQRDRYAEFVFLMANIAASVERLATEIRLLQRSEVGEVMEPFDEKKQVGSSTMAQKRNPVTCENSCGLARIIRAYVTPALENVPLWHERDLTNSSAERMMMPHACILTDYILRNMTTVVKGMKVRPEAMLANLKATKGLIMSESVMIALVGKGMDRQDAHELLRVASARAVSEGRDLHDILSGDETVKKHLTPKELRAALEYSCYTGTSAETVERLARKLGRKAPGSRR